MTFDEISRIMASSAASDWTSGGYLSAAACTVAAYKNDVLLRLESAEDDVHNDNFKEEWANNFPDPAAKSYYIRLYYGSTYLKCYILVSVDGARAMLPVPDSATMLRVTPERYLVASVFDTSGTLDKYMQSASLTVV